MSFTNEFANFNASMEVTELLMKTLENAAKKLAARCISEIANRHGFDAEKEIQALGLENLSVVRKQMAKKTAGEKKEKKPREPKKSVFPMPFFAENVNSDGCQGLAYNRGLFTQCQKDRIETGDYCKGCQTETDKNASGCPDCGNVSSRLATGLYDFKDPKGRSPISYVKIIKKLNITLEQVLEETGKIGKTIPEEHLVVAEKKLSGRGRPKKVNAVETDDLSVVSDLFSKLTVEKDKEEEVLEVLEEEVLEEEVLEEELESPVKTKKSKLSEDEKAEKKAALEAEKAEKAALEAEKKRALEAEKAEKKRALEAEKEAEKAEKKRVLEAEKAEKKRALEAEKAEKKEAEKAERLAKREAEKAQKKNKKVDDDKGKEKVDDEGKEKVDDEGKEKVTETPVEPVPVQNTVKVNRIQISGKSYLKTSNNLLYNPDTKEEVGIWDPETKTIKPLPEDEDEEEQEEEYDSN
jgi:hypothetical protein